LPFSILHLIVFSSAPWANRYLFATSIILWPTKICIPVSSPVGSPTFCTFSGFWKCKK
jgi:hypothetical protein